MTKIFFKTKTNQDIEVDLSSEVEEKYGVRPGTVCIRKSDRGNDSKRVIVVGTHASQLWFAREENGEYRLSFWDDTNDKESFKQLFDVFKTPQYTEGDLLNMITRSSENRVNELLQVRKAIDILVKCKWLHQTNDSQLSQKDRDFQARYEERVRKLQSTNWPGKKETVDEIIHKINHLPMKFSRNY